MKAMSLLKLSALSAAIVCIGVPAGASWAAFPGKNGKIVFMSNRTTTKNLECDYEVFTAKPNGTGLRQLTDNDLYGWAPTFSPDGKKIAFEAL